MFALEWCEFCWSVRKLIDRYQIPYRSINVDSVEYQREDRGGALRAALKERTGSVTLPQLFIGGEFVGGCTTCSTKACKGGCSNASRHWALCCRKRSPIPMDSC